MAELDIEFASLKAELRTELVGLRRELAEIRAGINDKIIAGDSNLAQANKFVLDTLSRLDDNGKDLGKRVHDLEKQTWKMLGAIGASSSLSAALVAILQKVVA